MASISKQPNGGKVVQYVALDGSRQTLRLGKVSMEWAREVKRHVEALLAARVQQTAPERPTLDWIARLDAKLRSRLFAKGLIEQPAEEKAAAEQERSQQEADAKPRLGEFLAAYAARRVDVKPATLQVWSQTQRNLVDFFTADRTLESIGEGEAEDFKMYMLGEKLAPTTVSKRLQFARQVFRAAKKRKLIADNPFADVKSAAAATPERQHFITRDATARLLEACPNVDWRVIVSLCRFGGLRSPSEVLSLRWQDVNWGEGRMRVRSPKTEHHIGKASREVPLFPELAAVLGEAFDAAPEGAEYVIADETYRAAADTAGGWRNCNMRTQFKRILLRAGLVPWPRLFHNMRASRETELAQEYPIHVVTAWLGNTPKIAMKHYLMTTDADFQKAAGGGALQKALQMVTGALQNAVHTGNAASCTESQEKAQPLDNKGFVQLRALSDGCASWGTRIRTDSGFIEKSRGCPPRRRKIRRTFWQVC